ncbi:UvrD-helicase domain-containing protein [Sphingomonas sp. Leaf30]|uniref:UvrD-helicase domain-containing protein n=1 Tax=Sphingomonas sp. Leaf30 TaxID=1736213 RepID=UPI0006FDAE3E|nr:UvrD-helicase domain-containing protein [Sphingomonas sp. Leaf30]KQN14089.1 DNA helicase [Sphingomonas sp. Leaf30]
MTVTYRPTLEQDAVIWHDGCAFVTACPGAGKTRTMVERARRLLSDRSDRRGVAFLSFTNTAVDELEARLRSFGVLPSPIFPSFIGTFDRFLWQFFVAPFGIDGCDTTPRLIPDKPDWPVQPHETMQAMPLRAFDRTTGVLDRAIATELRFNRDPGRHQARALRMLAAARTKGHVDFEDVRECVRGRLADKPFAARLGKALAARFREIIVDEAQDCNPADLDVVQWLRDSGITVKVICDPNQSIYKFRGGVTDELDRFAERFEESERLPMSGNFRSTPAICSAIVALRPPAARGAVDQALGPLKDELNPVHILSYGGTSVPKTIGAKFGEIAGSLGIQNADAPILASRLPTAGKAIGHPAPKESLHMTLVLARAVTDFHFSFGLGNRREALVALHRAVLQVQGHIHSPGEYHAHVAGANAEDGKWRPGIIEIASKLKFDPGDTAEGWLAKAQALLGPGLVASGSIGQRMRKSPDLPAALASAPLQTHPARTIHSAKGLEFAAVCVVMTSKKTGKVIDHLQTGGGNADDAEDARKIYVAASRAKRLLVLAVPRNSAARLEALLASTGCTTQRHDVV